jgi:hypothetical protein
MRKIALATLAAAAVLSGGMLAKPAEAMTIAQPSALGLATTTDNSLVQDAAYVCGWRGCFHVWRPYYGYHAYYRPWGYYGRPWRRWY